MSHFAHTVVPLGDLIPYPNNARTHSEAQVAKLAGAIREFGFTSPVLVDEQRNVIAGHGRIEAARKLGMSDVPAIVVTGLDDTRRRALILADNRLALDAGWDEEMLVNELRSLGDAAELTGFDPEELMALLAEKTEQGLTDEDEVPELSEDAVTQLGDVWLLGNHRLVCGDCTSADDVDKALNGVKPHLMVTDPPYGVEYDPGWRLMEMPESHGSGGAYGKVQNDDRADWSEAWALFPGDVAYVWHAPGPLQVVVYESLVSSGFECRNHIVWAKNQFVIGHGHYHIQHEPCWYAVRKSATGHWNGDRKQSTVWQISKSYTPSETGHSTQKPVECMRRPVVNNSSPGQAVYEPFSGSGTTIIACETEGRVCHALEIHPPYVDVAVKRWQEFTGKQATLERTGQTFDELSVNAEAA
jgi:DNA modification methylase